MNESEYIAKTVNEILAANSPLVIVSIIGMQGSAPRHSGTKMVADTGGKAYGTIGGSLLEAAAIKETKAVIATGKSKILHYEFTGKDAAVPDMICGGKAEILLEYLAASEANKAFSGHWNEAIIRGKDFYVLTHLKKSGDDVEVYSHAVMHPDGNIIGSTSLKEPDIAKLKAELHNISTSDVVALDDTSVLVDRIRKPKTLYCFGGGHVAVPAVHMAALAGFRVAVIDDRSEYANAERFPEAEKLRVAKDFDRAFEGLEIDADSYIVIVTRGHQYDRKVLDQALKTKAGYIGMISSKKKRAAIYESLISQGVKKEQLEQVHSPIGIDIGGETPEEIAVSIVAELIQVRSEQSA